MTWPMYSRACRKEVDQLLKAGGSLSAYRASDAFPKWIGPKEGSHAWKLEREIEAKFKVKHAIAVNSGTAALHAGLVAAGVEGRDVVTSPLTFSATASAIILAGGTPVFADVDPYTYCITKATVSRVITKRTAAILPVHLFGYFPDLSGLQSFGVPVIEDACQAVGSLRSGAYAGTVGVSGCFSFNGSKNVPAGEGGCLVTNSDKIAEKARLLINHGENFYKRRCVRTLDVGFNYRMQEVVACIARHGLKDLDERNETRRNLVDEFLNQLSRFASLGPDGGGWYRIYTKRFGTVWFHQPERWESHAFYVYPFTVERNREEFINRMANRGIHVQAGYTTPLHHLPAFKKYAKAPLSNVEKVHRELCLITTFTPNRPLSYAAKVAKAIRESIA